MPRINRNVVLIALAVAVGSQGLMPYCLFSSLAPVQAASLEKEKPELDDGKEPVDEKGADGKDSPSVPIASLTPTTAPTQIPDMTVEGIKIEGNRLVPTEDIMGVVKTKPGDRFDRDRVLGDLKAINGMGYFDDRSLQVVPEPTGTGSGILLKIRVQENEPVTQFSFQGNEVLSTDEISKIFADQLGKPQNLNQLSSAIDKVEQAYHARGFLLAKVVDVKDDPDGSINLSISEGSIDKVEIVGNHKTKDFIVRNAIKVKPGQVYNERTLTADLRKLYNEGYFQDIRRSLVPSASDPDKYTLKVEVDEKRTGSVGLGGGIDAMSGPFGSVNFSDANFRGVGQVLSFNGQAGLGMMNSVTSRLSNGGQSFMPNQRTYQVEANWIEPHLKGTDTSLALSGFGRNLNSMMIDYAQQQTVGASATFSHPLGKNLAANLGFTGDNTILRNAGTALQQEQAASYLSGRIMQTGLASDPVTASQMAGAVRASQLQGGLYASINPSVQYDTRDNVMDPNKGSYVKVTGTPSLGITAGSFLRGGVNASHYVPVTKDSSLAFNMQGGASMGSLPAFAQYRLGGWNGLRGYRSFTDLGSGTSMLMATAEYRFKLPFVPKGDPKSLKGKVVNTINNHVKGTVFSDFGAVGGDPLVNNLYQRSMMGASVGVGLRLNVPMLGVIRLDYGFPLINSALGGMKPRFTVGFGNKF